MDEKLSTDGAEFSSGLSEAEQAMDVYDEDLKAAMGGYMDNASADEMPASEGAVSTDSGVVPASTDASCACHDQPPRADPLERVKDGALPNLFEVVLPGVSKFLEDYGEDIGTALDMLEAEDAAEAANDSASNADQQA